LFKTFFLIVIVYSFKALFFRDDVESGNDGGQYNWNEQYNNHVFAKKGSDEPDQTKENDGHDVSGHGIINDGPHGQEKHKNQYSPTCKKKIIGLFHWRTI
jgi:hypothetical protein